MYEGPDSQLTALSDEKELQLAVALARRTDRSDLGLLRLKAQYPDAPEQVLSSAAYHLYSELVSSFVSVLAQIELNLRDPSHELSSALVEHPAYHLYNWLQLQALLPWSQQDFHDELLEVKTCLADNDTDSAKEILERILDQFEGSASAPKPDFP